MSKDSRRLGMLALFTLVVFLAMLVTFCMAALAVYLLVRAGTIQITGVTAVQVRRLIGLFALFSIPSGVVIALLTCNLPLKPIRDLIDSMDRLASGDFKTRVNAGFFMRRYPPFVGLSESFNKMAEQLESTELLRSDFINNFSHEFKTPIVSIAGFAKLLRRGNLTPEQQQEYLAVIEEESQRLSYMATNVLDMTKLENQTILSDVSRFNLSEQIRDCILLLERKWTQKELEFSLSLQQEHSSRAN